MEQTSKHFISKLTKRSGRIERDGEDIEREELEKLLAVLGMQLLDQPQRALLARKLLLDRLDATDAVVADRRGRAW